VTIIAALPVLQRSHVTTSQESTNYHFEVAPAALRGALDRFAQFFLSPLCLEGSLEREVRCITRSPPEGTLRSPLHADRHCLLPRKRLAMACNGMQRHAKACMRG